MCGMGGRALLCIYPCLKSCSILRVFQAFHHGTKWLLMDQQPGFPEEIFSVPLRSRLALGLLRLLYNGYCKLNGRRIKMAIYLHLLPRLRMHEVMPPHMPYIIMSLCLINSLKPFSQGTLHSQRTTFRENIMILTAHKQLAERFQNYHYFTLYVYFIQSSYKNPATDSCWHLYKMFFMTSISFNWKTTSVLCNAAVCGFNNWHSTLGSFDSDWQ